MKGVEDVKGEGTDWPNVGRRQQARTEELDSVRRPSCVSITTTELRLDVVDAVCVDYREIFDQVAGNGTWVTVMAKKYFDPESLHRRSLKTLASPLLVTNQSG